MKNKWGVSPLEVSMIHTMEDLNSLEKKINQLKIQYDQFFSGVIRQAPVKLREEIQQTVRQSVGQRLGNATLKFRLQSLISRFNSYIRYWDRVLREIEEGRSPRDRFRQASPVPPPKQVRDRTAPVEGCTFNTNTEFSGKKEQDKLQDLYQKLVGAREQCNQSAKISMDTLQQIVQSQTQKITEQYQCKSVEYRIDIEGGQAKLRASPKK